MVLGRAGGAREKEPCVVNNQTGKSLLVLSALLSGRPSLGLGGNRKSFTRLAHRSRILNSAGLQIRGHRSSLPPGLVSLFADHGAPARTAKAATHPPALPGLSSPGFGLEDLKDQGQTFAPAPPCQRSLQPKVQGSIRMQRHGTHFLTQFPNTRKVN